MERETTHLPNCLASDQQCMLNPVDMTHMTGLDDGVNTKWVKVSLGW